MLVLRRIRVNYHLNVDPGLRDAVERAHAVHADFCPVARSIGGSVAISTEIAYER